MEISRDLINNHSSFYPATFLIIHGFNSLVIDLFHTLSSPLEVCLVIHDIVDITNLFPILIEPVLV